MRVTRSLALLLVGGVVGVSMAVGVVLPADAATAYLPGVPDPLFPHHVVYYDNAGGKWNEMLDAATENDALAQRALAASKNAQTVPASFWQRQVAAVKAGTSKFTTVAQVMEQGDLTKYAPEAILVQEGKLTGTAVQLAQATAAAPKIPLFAASTLLKGAGTVGLVLSAYQMGTAVGDFGMSVFGVDAKGIVCGSTGQDGTGKFVALLAGQTCADNAADPAYIRNADAATQVSSASACNTAGVCLAVSGQFYNPSTSMAVTGFGKSGTVTQNSQDVTIFFDNGTNGGFRVYPPGQLTGTYPSPTWSAWTSKNGSAARVISGWHFSGAEYTTVTPVSTAPSNPQRNFKTTITGSDGQQYTASTPNFYEGDTTYPLPAMPTLPVGVTPTNMKVQEVAGSGGTTSDVYNTGTTQDFKDLIAAYPECGTGKCLLDLRVAGASCYEGLTDCADWFASPTRDSDYSCKYGTHAVALTECYTLAEAFKPAAIASGQTGADPTTGAALGAAVGDPAGGPAMDTTVQDASQPRSCFPTGWAVLNPVNWVLQPVQCALEWAFVPRASVIKGYNDADNGAAGGGAIGSIGGVMGSLLAFPIIPNGCGGIPWDFHMYTLTVHANLLATCPGDVLQPASVMVHSILVGTLWTVAVLAWIRYIAVIFGYTGFGSGVTPGPVGGIGGPIDLGELRQSGGGSIGQRSQRAIGR